MAKLIEKENILKTRCNKYKKMMVGGYAFCGCCFVLWALNIMVVQSFNPLFLAPTFFGFALGGIIAALGKKKYDILSAGIGGEDATRNILSRLPDTYTVISNMHITFEGQSSEMDNVVIGDSGIFVIETKNLKGEISGNYNDNRLTQIKLLQNGEKVRKEFYNPVKQVSTHVYRLANYLRQNQINVFVHGIVFFSNPEATINVSTSGEKTPIFSISEDGQNELLSYISEAQNSISSQAVEQIVALLSK